VTDKQIENVSNLLPTDHQTICTLVRTKIETGSETDEKILNLYGNFFLRSEVNTTVKHALAVSRDRHFKV
jgi:hypothetical protein